MIKKFPLPNFKLLLFISALFTFSNAFSANWYVNDNSTTGDVYSSAVGNNANTGTSPSSPKLTLLAAYTLAAAGDTIFIDTGTYSGSGNINLTITKANLSFTGAGSLKTIFDNNFASANSNLWLTINANNININGISATEFNAISAGKVVTVNGQTVTFNDVIFFNNGNNGNGALYITSGSNVTYTNSSTTCNASLLWGGGIDLVGNNSVLNISNCIIATNKKEGNGDGGGVLVKGSGSNNDIERTEEIKERSLMYEGLKHYFMIQFPQRPGALREFVNEVMSESDDITYFQFIKKNNRDVGPVVVGLEVKNENDIQAIKVKMNSKGFQFEYLNENNPLLALLI